jgi:hypothetical protein
MSNVLTGVAALSDWIGQGGTPVPPEEAQRRATICLTCPLNQNQQKGMAFAAIQFRRFIASKNQANLHIVGEENLKVCTGCNCYLPLKCWIPMENITPYLSEESMVKMREAKPDCWQLPENQTTSSGSGNG